MHDHLKWRVSVILATARTVTLSTAGPAGIQARLFHCEADGVHLFLLLPGTSDHLLNLEEDSLAVASTSGWQLRGFAQVLQLQEGPDNLLLPQLPEAIGCVLVKILPSQLQIYRKNGWGFRETIDFDPDSQTLPQS
jgi:hypothetical protein